ncbi:MAG: outer membrane beta-barrel protein, partial [Gammaproteobacteria bacterium]
MTSRMLRALLALVLALVAAGATASDAARPYGSLFRALAGETLETEHEIAVLGFAHVTAAVANHDISKSLMPQGRARSIQPQSGVVQDEGLNLQHVGLIVCKGAGCPAGHVFEPNRNVISRVTPLPGPRGERVIVDWAVSALVGEDGVYWSTKGFDDFRWNADDAHRLAITQWYLDFYLPIAGGASLLIGSWHSPLASEIGYAFVPPNWFSSRSYAFMAGPSKHLGALAQLKLPLDPAWGPVSLSFGVVSDWNSLDFGSGAGGPSFMFGASWRSADMRTWLDVETIWGNGEDDFGDVAVKDGVARPRGGGSQYLALSSRDEFLDRFMGYLVLRHQTNDRLGLLLEGVYGFQEGGDLAPLPFAITRDSALYGVNAGLRYRLADGLHL